VVADRLRHEPGYRTPGRYVRTNAVGSERFIQDIKAVVRPGLEGLVISKVDTVAQVRIAEDELGRAEVARHMPGGSVKLLLAIESPIGLFNAYQIASSSPSQHRHIVRRRGFHARDESPNAPRSGSRRYDLCKVTSCDGAAAAAHVQAVDGVWVDLDDMEGMRRFAKQARAARHERHFHHSPKQIEDANAAFTPNKEDIDYAQPW
jgi:citrate lyase subunit beta/citryl-CoA lyase